MKPTRGVKLAPQPTNSARIRELDTEVKNLQMAGRVNQMMVQQLLQNFQNISQDLTRVLNIVDELQYKVLALQEINSVDKATLLAKTNALRISAFEEASDKEDREQGFTVAGTVEEGSTVIITSTALNEAGEDAGILRSRIPLAETGVPALMEGLLGKKPGATVECELAGIKHTVTLLGVRTPPAPTEETVATDE